MSLILAFHLDAGLGNTTSNATLIDGRRRSTSVMNVGLAKGAGDNLFHRLSRTFSGKSQDQQEDELEEHEIERWTSSNEKGEVDDLSERTKVNEWRLNQHVKDIQANDPADGRILVSHGRTLQSKWYLLMLDCRKTSSVSSKKFNRPGKHATNLQGKQFSMDPRPCQLPPRCDPCKCTEKSTHH